MVHHTAEVDNCVLLSIPQALVIERFIIPKLFPAHEQWAYLGLGLGLAIDTVLLGLTRTSLYTG